MRILINRENFLGEWGGLSGDSRAVQPDAVTGLLVPANPGEKRVVRDDVRRAVLYGEDHPLVPVVLFSLNFFFHLFFAEH